MEPLLETLGTAKDLQAKLTGTYGRIWAEPTTELQTQEPDSLCIALKWEVHVNNTSQSGVQSSTNLLKNPSENDY